MNKLASCARLLQLRLRARPPRRRRRLAASAASNCSALLAGRRRPSCDILISPLGRWRPTGLEPASCLRQTILRLCSRPSSSSLCCCCCCCGGRFPVGWLAGWLVRVRKEAQRQLSHFVVAMRAKRRNFGKRQMSKGGRLLRPSSQDNGGPNSSQASRAQPGPSAPGPRRALLNSAHMRRHASGRKNLQKGGENWAPKQVARRACSSSLLLFARSPARSLACQGRLERAPDELGELV